MMYRQQVVNKFIPQFLILYLELSQSSINICGGKKKERVGKSELMNWCLEHIKEINVHPSQLKVGGNLTSQGKLTSLA